MTQHIQQSLSTILQCPIPDYSYGREQKKHYRNYPLYLDSERNDEPLVDVAEFGIAGQSYYSRKNTATGEPLPGVEPEVMVRASVAQRLADINYELQRSQVVTELLGGKVELYLDEGLRSFEVQKQLYEDYFPHLIRKRHPELSELEVLAKRDRYIAKPSNERSPAPHATGSAVDIKLRYAQEEGGFVSKGFVEMGHARGELEPSTQPDYFEQLEKLTPQQQSARANRRIFYWVMRGALLGDDSGFEVNPEEWWHWSYGDQLWAQSRRAPYAFFGLPPT